VLLSAHLPVYAIEQAPKRGQRYNLDVDGKAHTLDLVYFTHVSNSEEILSKVVEGSVSCAILNASLVHITRSSVEHHLCRLIIHYPASSQEFPRLSFVIRLHTMLRY